MLQKELLIAIILSGLLIAAPLSQAHACVGARPMAMGGAFIGVADDVNATYWNPAGLVQLDGMQATYTRTMNRRDRINYDDYIAAAGYIEEVALPLEYHI